jgi:maltooligosyltrehalose trehalohydrolase
MYMFELDGGIKRPDPASFYQPGGVHKPSAVVDHGSFTWSDSAWEVPDPRSMIIYEIHVGTFTPEGTFEAVTCRLQELRDTGITAIEIMPVAQFPGQRNWGYDGTYPFAVQNSYGGPDQLKNLVNAAHREGIAVILDVVYNHLGPEGNYLRDFGPYFTDTYQTPWGEAVNFDGPHSNHVRHYFICNALYWFGQFHIDALRLDAVHGIFDLGAKHILSELSEEVRAFAGMIGRPCCLIAESDLNDSRVIRDPERGGYGIDIQWNDDYHHSLHSLLTGEESGYYQDFGSIDDLATAIREGFVYSWKYSRFRKRFHGNRSSDLPPDSFVIFSQNHDQVGNRAFGERLSALVPFEALKLAAAAVLLTPGIPLLFMGEEYGEQSPFLYFIHHGDSELVSAVREGRKMEFAPFIGDREPPDPQAVETYEASRLQWELRGQEKHNALLQFYRHLIRFRTSHSDAIHCRREDIDVTCCHDSKAVCAAIHTAGSALICIFNCHHRQSSVSIPVGSRRWEKALDSGDVQWSGPGSEAPGSVSGGPRAAIPVLPYTALVYERCRT